MAEIRLGGEFLQSYQKASMIDPRWQRISGINVPKCPSFTLDPKEIIITDDLENDISDASDPFNDFGEFILEHYDDSVYIKYMDMFIDIYHTFSKLKKGKYNFQYTHDLIFEQAPIKNIITSRPPVNKLECMARGREEASKKKAAQKEINQNKIKLINENKKQSQLEASTEEESSNWLDIPWDESISEHTKNVVLDILLNCTSHARKHSFSDDSKQLLFILSTYSAQQLTN